MSVVGNQWMMTILQDKFGAYFIGSLLLKLCFLFSILSSVNLCCMAKAYPFIINFHKFWFQVSKQHSLNIGLYGSGQGGEHSNKEAKARMFSWTHLRYGFFSCFLKTAMYVLIAAKVLFSSFVPKKLAVWSSLCPLLNNKHQSMHLLQRHFPCWHSAALWSGSWFWFWKQVCNQFFGNTKIWQERFVRNRVSSIFYWSILELPLDTKFDGCKSGAVAFQFLMLLHLGFQGKLNWVQNGKNQDSDIAPKFVQIIPDTWTST